MNTNSNQHKRMYRGLSDMTRQKISMAMKGRTKSDTHREAISKGLKSYWKTVPESPSESEPTNPTYQPDNRLQNGATERVNINSTNDKI